MMAIKGNMKTVLLAIMAALVIQLLICYIQDARAIDEDVKQLLRKVTGITDADMAAAEKKKEITLFDAYTLAVRKTERLAIEGENSIQAEERKLQAIETFLPYFSLRGNYAFPKPDSKYISMRQSGASLYARQPIITGLKEISQIQSSWADRRIKEYLLYNNAGQLLAGIGTAFYSVLLVQRDLANSEHLLDLYTQTVTELKRRVNIGRSRQSEILRTNAKIYSLQAQIKSLRTGLEHSRLLLSTLIGLDTGFDLVDSEVFLEKSSFTIADTQKLVEARWDVKAAQELMEYAKAGVTAAYGLHLPSIYIEGIYAPNSWQGKQYEISKSKLGSSLALSPNPGSSYLSGSLNGGVPTKMREWYVGIGAEMPIFGGDITFAKVREANSIKRQSDLVMSQTLRLARQDIIDAFQVWES
jgi:outer membrane protein TolC